MKYKGCLRFDTKIRSEFWLPGLLRDMNRRVKTESTLLHNFREINYFMLYNNWHDRRYKKCSTYLLTLIFFVFYTFKGLSQGANNQNENRVWLALCDIYITTFLDLCKQLICKCNFYCLLRCSMNWKSNCLSIAH